MTYLITLKNPFTGDTRIMEIKAESHVDAMKIVKPQLHDNECVYSVQKERERG